MKNKKIVLIGSGSQFTEFYLQELFKYPEFKGVTLAFVDRKIERLNVVKGIAEKINQECNGGIRFEGFTDRRDALVGADIVYCFAAVNYKEAWKMDRQICNRHGLNPYEFHTSSVSSLSMGSRHIPMVLDMCKDIEEICPNAWFVLDNNPLTKIVAAVLRHTKTKCFGYCNGHELEQSGVEEILGTSLMDEPDNAQGWEREFMVPEGNVSMQQIGINHMAWVVNIRDAKTGEDLYPKLRKIVQETPIDKLPLGFRFSAEILKRVGYFPSCGDTHVVDYMWCIDDEIAKLCDVRAFDVDAWFGGRDKNAWAEIASQIKDPKSIQAFIKQRRTGWQSTQIARIMLGGKYEYFPAINIMNNGCISNMNDDVVVELPGVLGPDFAQGIKMGPLPDPLLAYCQLHATQANLIADACALGDHEKALQALLMDPYVCSITKAHQILDDVIKSNSIYETNW